MAKIEVKKIHSLDRMRNSAAGNPRYRVFFTDGTSAETKPDASCNYGLENPEYGSPNMVKVTYERGKIALVEPVRTH